ncbi:tolloid-like protein 1 [Ptychodera flava]|uniref:tolloid-like protein 1 n=1 Tax=Ptychodera flava TaxID=63121 RepID=UPI00396A3945
MASLWIFIAVALSTQSSCLFRVYGQVTQDPGACGGTLIIPDGGHVDVMSPNYPDDYPMNADCEWHISTNMNTKIFVEHWDFQTETGYDFYSAGNGKDSSESSSVIWMHSGPNLPPDFTSTGISVWINFTSDHIIADRGFRNRLYDTGLTSCDGLCGFDNPAQGCSCDKSCTINDNCCSDYFDVCAGDCVEHITVPEAGEVIITSPNYPDNYPNDAQCQWIITTQRHSLMQVRFTEFYTQPGKDLYFAGNGDEPSQDNSVVWAHSGYSAPEDFLSTDYTIWMRFVSDYDVTEKGFHIVVEDMYRKGTCANACDTFDAEHQCSCFRNCIYDNNCCVDYFEHCGGNCSETIYVDTSTSVDVTSPNYPANYPNDVRCEWIIRQNGPGKLFVDYVDFATEAGYDHYFAGHGDQPSVNSTVEVWAHSGQNLPQSFISDDDSVWMRFVSDSSTTDRGFHAVVENLGSTCREECNTYNQEFQCSCYTDCFYLDECCDDYVAACAASCTYDLTVNVGESVLIESNLYPDLYPPNQACRWIVRNLDSTLLKIDFNDFNTLDSSDFSFGDGEVPSEETSVVWRYSGNSAPDDYMSLGSAVWVTFTSDNTLLTRRGFSLTVSEFSCFQAHIVPTGGKITITSPRYPEDYPNDIACRWEIDSESGNTMLVEYQDFVLQDCCDYYSAGNGKVPSQETSVIWEHNGINLPPDFTSSGPSVWMTLTTDSAVSARGFRITVTDTGSAS